MEKQAVQNKVDFAVTVRVDGGNPNGDPGAENYPRSDEEGYGSIEDVCLKRKIRNRMMANGNPVFVQSEDKRQDDYGSLSARAKARFDAIAAKKRQADGEKKAEPLSRDEQYQAACETWLDVRAFGNVFSYKNKGVETFGIRGPVTVRPAKSVAPIKVREVEITKSVNGDDGEKRGSDTMGTKYRVEENIYVFYGSVHPELAAKTSFSADDLEELRKTLCTLFEGDASSSRPDGSMEVVNVIWWQHSCPLGDLSSAKLQRSLTVNLDGSFAIDQIDGAPKPEILEGF